MLFRVSFVSPLASWASVTPSLGSPLTSRPFSGVRVRVCFNLGGCMFDVQSRESLLFTFPALWQWPLARGQKVSFTLPSEAKG